MKRFTAILMATLMVLAFFVPAANAIEKNEVWNGEIADSFESGDGTFESPYIIAKPSQLALLAQLVNNGIGDFATLYYAVTNQLVLNGDTISNQWMPIGTAEQPFRGYFDGGEYPIIKAFNDSCADNLGIFGVVENAAISNVKVLSAYFAGDEYVGGIVGYAKNSTFHNCVLQGEVNGNLCVGGIAGAAYNSIIHKCITLSSTDVSGYVAHTGGIAGDSSSDVLWCENNAAVNGADNTGGIVGFNLYQGLIKLCTNKGLVIANSSVGGIAGYNMGEIMHCANYAAPVGFNNIGGICGVNMLYAVVSSCENFAEIYIPVDYSPAENVGGIVGYNRSAEISFSINNGNLLKEGMGGNLGGIAGQSFGGYINGCINKAYVTNNFDSNTNVAGIVGKTDYSEIKLCENSGTISGNPSANTTYVGGIAGSSFSYITNSFNRGLIFGGKYLGGLTGRNNGVIENSYNAGNIEELLGAGSITGINDSEGFIYDCYYLDTTIGFSLSNFGTMLTDAEMQDPTNFYGFYFPNIWIMSTGDYLYPILNFVAKDVEIIYPTDFLFAGEAMLLDAIVSPIVAYDRQVTWSVDSDAATIDQTGFFTAIKAGFVRVKAQCGNASDEVYITISQKFTVTFVDGLTDEVLGTTQVLNGNVITEFPEPLEHEHYHFIGWDYDNTPIYKDTTITALYEINKYSVKFVDGVSGVSFFDTYVDAGTVLTDFPVPPSYTEYRFTGWDYDNSPIYANTVITALYEPIPHYSVTFKDGLTDNTILVRTVLEGSIITEFPDAPVHDGYRFKGWDYDGSPITGNTIITALYEPIPQYTVTFKDGVTNEDILTISVLEGTIITEFPNAPEHDGYEFLHWDYNNKPIMSDTVITAVYREIQYYTVTFKDGVTNDTIDTITVREETIITEFPNAPEHDGYEFVRWDYNNLPITSDTVITALYREIIYYTVTFIDGVTNDIIDSVTVKENTFITDFPNAPYHEGYEFSHWDYDGSPITKNTVITAIYNEIVYHNVTFVDGLTGEVISTVLVEEGQVVTEFPTPVEHIGYEFEKWDYDNTPITKDTTITALYKQTYTLGDINNDGKVNTGDAVVVLMYSVGKIQLSEVQLLASDYNRDGKINTGDATSILKALVA